MISELDCRTLHETYVSSTGLQLQFTMQRMYAYEQFLVRNFTDNDLKLVVKFLKRRIRDRRRNPECLSFRNLIERLDLFEEDLSMARAELRQFQERGDPNRESVLAATGRTQVVDKPARTPEKIMSASKAFAAFQAFRMGL